MAATLRPFKATDTDSVLQIAADTAFFGDPVEHFMEDRRLFCDAMYCYYIMREAAYAWVAEDEGHVLGFLVGCIDTKAYPRNYVFHTLPGLTINLLTARYRIGRRTCQYIGGLVRTLFRHGVFRMDLNAYPAHLHINVTAAARGQGIGRRLLQAYLDQLQQLAVPGVHLHTTDQNIVACKLYEKMGFQLLDARPTEAWAAFIHRPIANHFYGLSLV
jgi:ribosomal protein S18 acetylase RimI-like enzyme